MGGLEEENCEFSKRSSSEPELVFSFQLIILLEQFRLLESKKERFIYIKINPSPSHQDSSPHADAVGVNWKRHMGTGEPAAQPSQRGGPLRLPTALSASL